jgi:hypothetical protein
MECWGGPCNGMVSDFDWVWQPAAREMGHLWGRQEYCCYRLTSSIGVPRASAQRRSFVIITLKAWLVSVCCGSVQTDTESF